MHLCALTLLDMLGFLMFVSIPNMQLRALTVSTSHTTAFLKAAMASCRSALVDGTKLTTDKIGFKELCNEGWQWVMLSWKVEQMIPELPAWMQMVLNSSNAVAVQMTELEAAQQIALLFGQSHNLAEAISTVKSSAPRCSPYLDCIGQYVKVFGGGSAHKFPIITFLDNLQKSYGKSVSIGQEMFEHITLWNLGEVSTQAPLLRAGMLAAQLTAPKVMDGQGRCLNKADLDRLKQVGLRPKILAAESHLKDAWEIYLRGGMDKMLKAYGKLLVRVVLHLCSKEKSGREGKIFQDVESIVAKFTEEVAGDMGATSAVEQATSSQEEIQDLLSLDNAGEQALVQNQHLVVGSKHSSCINISSCETQR